MEFGVGGEMTDQDVDRVDKQTVARVITDGAAVPLGGCPAQPVGFACISRTDATGPTCPLGHSLRQRRNVGVDLAPTASRRQPSEKRRTPGRARRLWSDAHDPGVR